VKILGSLIRALREVCADLFGRRRGTNVRYSMIDSGMADRHNEPQHDPAQTIFARSGLRRS
jgi:hypothetical protein